MDDTLIWCALIGAVAYAIKPMLPTYYELTKVSQHRLDIINDAVDDNEQTMLAMGKKLEDLQSDIAGHLTRLDDIDGRAIVGLRAVNVLHPETGQPYRYSVQAQTVNGEWADIPVGTMPGTVEEYDQIMAIVEKQKAVVIDAD